LERFELIGRVAVVTGASEGIGRGLAVGLAAAGADVVVWGRSEESLHEVAAEIEALGRSALVAAVDVRDPEQVAQLRRRCAAEFAHIDILVNSAGYYVNDISSSHP
jgi:NADP-dependent 3-hydroxy acid dehydrogenase YdfG